MGSFPKGDIHVNKYLSNVAVAYKNANMIADLAIPDVPVDKDSDLFPTFGKEHYVLHDDHRAPGDEAVEVKSYSVSSTAYFCAPRAVKDIVPDEDISNADAIVNAEVATTEGLVMMRLLRKEYGVANMLFDTSLWTNTAALAAVDTWEGRWDNYDYSDPIRKIDEKIESIRQLLGMKPDTITMGAAVWNKVKRHPEVIDIFFKGRQAGIVTPDMFATLFPSITKVLVGEAIVQSSNPGQSTTTYSDVWGKFCAIYIRGKDGEKKSAGAAKTFSWKLFGGKTMKVFKYREKARHGNMIEVHSAHDHKQTSDDSMYLLSTVVS